MLASDIWNRVKLPSSASAILYIPAQVLSSCIGIYRRSGISYDIENFASISYDQVVTRACEEMRSKASSWRHDGAQLRLLYQFILHFVYNDIVPPRPFINALVESRYIELGVKFMKKIRTVRGMRERRQDLGRARWDKDLFDIACFLWQATCELGPRYDPDCDLPFQIVESGMIGLIGEWSRDAPDGDVEWGKQDLDIGSILSSSDYSHSSRS